MTINDETKKCIHCEGCDLVHSQVVGDYKCQECGSWQENTNCLAGFKCPECGHTRNFLISATVWVDMHDDGSNGIEGDIEWEPESTCQCPNCTYTDDVKAFNPPEFSEDDESV